MYIRYAQQLKCTKMNTELKGLCKFVLFPVNLFYISQFSSEVRKSSQYDCSISYSALWRFFSHLTDYIIVFLAPALIFLAIKQYDSYNILSPLLKEHFKPL